MDEVRLHGGRVTEGVVRVGDTVRRPQTTNTAFVRDLLSYLDEQGFDGAPRSLGADELGRETFSYLPGEVPAELDPNLSDDVLVNAARLIRRFHDATAGSPLAVDQETVCHNDLSPCNFVFRHGQPVGIIDFDAAAPGRRVDDLGYAIFLCLNIGADGRDPDEQARRIQLFCEAYRVNPDRGIVDAILDAIASNVKRLEGEGRHADAEWWRRQLDWVTQHRDQLAP